MNKLLIIAGTFLMLSCNNADKNETAKTKTTEHAHTSVPMETPEVLELNNGEKWVVNEEMKPSVNQINESIRGYIANNETDHKKLAADLEVYNNNLIQSCTMKGKSHDELHKWLHPHLTLTKKLKEEENPENAKAIISDLEKSCDTYAAYFN